MGDRWIQMRRSNDEPQGERRERGGRWRGTRDHGRREEDRKGSPPPQREPSDSPGGREVHRRNRHRQAGRSPARNGGERSLSPQARRRPRKTQEESSQDGGGRRGQQARGSRRVVQEQADPRGRPVGRDVFARRSRSRSRSPDRGAGPARLVLRERSPSRSGSQPPAGRPANGRNNNGKARSLSPASVAGSAGEPGPSVQARQAAIKEKSEKIAQKLGYGVTKKPGEKKEKKEKTTVGFGYGASKTVAKDDGAESYSEYTSDSSEDGSSDSENAPANPETAGGPAEKGTKPKSPSKPKQIPQSAGASPASSNASSASDSDENSDDRNSSQGRPAQEPGREEGKPSAEEIASQHHQGWIANADGDKPRAKRKRTNSGAADTSTQEADPYQDVEATAETDPYAVVDPYLLDIGPAAGDDDDVTELDIAADAHLSAVTLLRSIDMTASMQQTQATSGDARQPADGATSKKRKWRRRVSWQPPPLLDIPETEDGLVIDVKLSMNSTESVSRRAQRDQPCAQEPGAASSKPVKTSQSDYISKCTELMNKLERNEPIDTTVLAFWVLLDEVERSRFGDEFPEFMRYTGE